MKVEPTERDWAQLASFIDGEGCIYLSYYINPSNGYSRTNLRLSISNTDPRLPNWCKERFKGRVGISDKKLGNKVYRPAIRWETEHANAEWILKGCLPYFILKREQAEAVLEFRQTIVPLISGRKLGLSQETQEKRELLRKIVKNLKQVILPIDTPSDFQIDWTKPFNVIHF